MYEVTEIVFNEISIEIAGAFLGPFTGTAGLDSDGAVVSLVIEAFNDRGLKFARLEVNRHQNTRRFDDAFAIVLADEIQDELRAEIDEALIDWADSCTVREPDFEAA